mmetsp:Transcript_44627/g.128980  ORF Transcript_44627/g.128980 Transcript_44627/m.128980 type:complete len:219 (+) Transcript_44627:2893-3549(+)
MKRATDSSGPFLVLSNIVPQRKQRHTKNATLDADLLPLQQAMFLVLECDREVDLDDVGLPHDRPTAEFNPRCPVDDLRPQVLNSLERGLHRLLSREHSLGLEHLLRPLRQLDARVRQQRLQLLHRCRLGGLGLRRRRRCEGVPRQLRHIRRFGWHGPRRRRRRAGRRDNAVLRRCVAPLLLGVELLSALRLERRALREDPAPALFGGEQRGQSHHLRP